MSWLINFIYFCLAAIASPWLIYCAALKGKYRSGWGEKLWGRVPQRTGDAPCAWFHAVSVGEVNLLPGLVAEFRRRHPHWQCVVTTTTATGHELAQRKFPELTVCYCPLDFSWAVTEALRRIRPDLLVLAELEVWPNLLRLAHERGAKVAVVNGRLSHSSRRGYARLSFLLRPMFQSLDLVAAQSETYADGFCELGTPAENVHVAGSMKFDGAETNRNNAATQSLAELAGFKPSDTVLLAGSTQEPEESLALETFRQLADANPSLRLVLVPRHPHRFEAVAELLDRSGIAWTRRSDLEHGCTAKRVLLVDTIGELAAWWGTARIALVGGSMGRRGGQNMIEPAAYGAAVCFGPNTRNFRDIVAMLLEANAAEVVRDGSELTEFVRRCLDEPGYAAALGTAAQSVVLSQLGATEKTLTLLDLLCDGAQVRKCAA